MSITQQAARLGTRHGKAGCPSLTEDELAAVLGTEGLDPEPYTVAYITAYEDAAKAAGRSPDAEGYYR